MKKKILAVLGLSLGMLLSACGGNSGSASSAASLHTSEPTSSVSSAASEEEGDGKTIETALTAQQAIALMDAAGESKVVEGELYVKGTFDSGTTVNTTYHEWTGTCGTLAISGATNNSETTVEETNGAMDGRTFVVKGYLELYKGAYKIGYLPASVSPTGEKYSPSLVKVGEGGAPVSSSEESLAPATEMKISGTYEAAVGDRVKVEGIVGQFSYSGASTRKGFVLFDETGSIVIYDADAAASVAIGNKVTLEGTIARYISSGDKSAAEEANYIGALQITTVTIDANDNGSNEIPETSYTATSLKSLYETPVSTDYTSRSFKFDAEISYTKTADYYNVFLNGADGKSYCYAYSTCNGADLAWLEPYNGSYRSVIVTIENAKPATGAWRVIVDKVLDEAEKPSDSEMVDYVLEHAVSQFKGTYNATVEVEAFSNDPDIEGGTATYASSSEYVSIEEGKVTITVPSTQATASIEITAAYGTSTANLVITFNLSSFDPSELTLTSIADARAASESTTVTVKGQVAQLVYGLSSNKGLAGFYIVDETSSMLVYPSSAELEKLSDAKIGETVYVTGTLGTGLADLGGFDNISDATILFQDFVEQDYPTGSIITGKTVSDLYNEKPTAGTNNIGRIYAVKATIGKTGGDGGTYSYINYTVTDADGGTSYLTLYTQNSSTSSAPYEWAWLEDYVGKTCNIYLGAQNTKSTSRYRWGVVKVLGEVEAAE